MAGAGGETKSGSVVVTVFGFARFEVEVGPLGAVGWIGGKLGDGPLAAAGVNVFGGVGAGTPAPVVVGTPPALLGVGKLLPVVGRPPPVEVENAFAGVREPALADGVFGQALLGAGG